MGTSVENVRAWIGLFLSLIPVINIIGSAFGFHLPTIDPGVIDGVSVVSGGLGVGLLARSQPITRA